MKLQAVSDTTESWGLCKMKFHPKESLSIQFPLFLQERSLLTSPVPWWIFYLEQLFFNTVQSLIGHCVVAKLPEISSPCSLVGLQWAQHHWGEQGASVWSFRKMGSLWGTSSVPQVQREDIWIWIDLLESYITEASEASVLWAWPMIVKNIYI